MAEEREKKRPRPLELSHSNLVPGEKKDMSEFALQCASPGLPPLSATMKTTVLLSKNIEQQQRQIIAQRTGADTAVDDEENVDKKTPSTSGLTDTMEELSIPSTNSNKRMRRNNVPTPLDLKSAHTAQRPIIKSAPIYSMPHQFFTPATARRSQFKKHQPLRSAVPHRFMRPTTMTPLTQVSPSAYPYRQRQPQIPKTATTLRHPVMMAGAPLTQQQMSRYQQQLAYQQQQWAKFKKYKESVSHVTDVFEGEGSRFAPLEAQPLSAQRKFFDVKPQIITREPLNEEDEDEDDEGNDDPESAAIEDDATVGMGITKEQVVYTELKLGNNVFKFEFERHGESDKQRFLNHCATAWDQYNKL
jgi:hypothetical protein